MQYLLLLYSTPETWAAKSDTEMAELMERHGKLMGDLKARDQYMGSNALEWAESATTLRVRDGKQLMTDGPYAETKEQLGGYYLVEAKDLDEAMDIASRIPDAEAGAVEIRPVKNVGL